MTMTMTDPSTSSGHEDPSEEPRSHAESLVAERPEAKPTRPKRQGKGKHMPKGPLWGNVLTITGGFLAGTAVILLMTFALFSVVTPSTNPYVDIVGYLILPSMLIVGLVMMPAGILFKSWRIKRYDPTQQLRMRMRIDLSEPGQRKLAKVMGVATFVFLPVVGVSSYHGYHYTDSSAFCGLACHAPMEPEATTYAQSPHARVPCAECHIGEGAGWFVKSKLSGTRQVLAMFRESYSRPIATAIQHLRPARETCEHCHWPKKFYGAQLKHFPHFAADEKNTKRDVTLLLNIGGGHHLTGRVEGIHWHMALANVVEYIATDDKLQVIPWVRMVDRYGEETIYRADGRPSSDPLPEGRRRTFDCMDCHNRPAHTFQSPDQAINRILDAGFVDADLPFIKREAVRALTQTYPDVETARKRIGGSLERFYRENYPEIWESDQSRQAVNRAIDGVREIYATNFFPYMRVDWRTYPDNIGHMVSTGCFRCHTKDHVNQRGESLTMACDVCHTFLGTATHADGSTTPTAGTFVHPWELVGVHNEVLCNECHAGGMMREATCAGCHAATTAFRTATAPTFASFGIEPDAMAESVECESCHEGAPRVELAAMNDTCLGCHDDDEERFDGMVTKWRSEIEAAIANVEPKLGESGRSVLEALRKAGPAHNMEATRKILKALETGDNTAVVPVKTETEPDAG